MTVYHSTWSKLNQWKNIASRVTAISSLLKSPYSGSSRAKCLQLFINTHKTFNNVIIKSSKKMINCTYSYFLKKVSIALCKTTHFKLFNNVLLFSSLKKPLCLRLLPCPICQIQRGRSLNRWDNKLIAKCIIVIIYMDFQKWYFHVRSSNKIEVCLILNMYNVLNICVYLTFVLYIDK